MSLVAVSTTGERVTWFDGDAKIVEVGQRTGAVFTAREAGPTDTPWLACEGETNALALSLSPWSEPGRVVSVGPAGNMSVVTVGGHDVILFADDDAAGHKAALKAFTAVRDLGRNASIHFASGIRMTSWLRIYASARRSATTVARPARMQTGAHGLTY